MSRHRAERIASAAGDGARATEVDGEWGVVVDGHEEMRIADRLARSSLERITVYSPDAIETCDFCHQTDVTAPGAPCPSGWSPLEDARGDLIGWACPSCAEEMEDPWEAVRTEGEVEVAGPGRFVTGTPEVAVHTETGQVRVRLGPIERTYAGVEWGDATDLFFGEFPVRDGGVTFG